MASVSDDLRASAGSVAAATAERATSRPAPGVCPAEVVELVIPVHNEAHVLEPSVKRLLAYLEKGLPIPWRVVIAENGSTDETLAVAEKLVLQWDAVDLIALPEKGRGGALRTVWRESQATYSIYMDVDLSTGLDALPRMLALLRRGVDLAVGSRLHADSNIRRSLKREILSRGYNFLLCHVLAVRSFDDAQCGFKGVRLDRVRPLLDQIENGNWFFDTELLVRAEWAGLSIAVLPIEWVEDPDSRVKLLQTIIEDLRGIARLRRLRRRSGSASS